MAKSFPIRRIYDATDCSDTGDTSWFVQDRFGLFIHWGLYLLSARHEWVKSREKISDEDYQKYFDHFNPDLYDSKARRLYLHVFAWPFKHLHLDGTAFVEQLEYAQLLNDVLGGAV